MYPNFQIRTVVDTVGQPQNLFWQHERLIREKKILVGKCSFLQGKSFGPFRLEICKCLKMSLSKLSWLAHKSIGQVGSIAQVPKEIMLSPLHCHLYISNTKSLEQKIRSFKLWHLEGCWSVFTVSPFWSFLYLSYDEARRVKTVVSQHFN